MPNTTKTSSRKFRLLYLGFAFPPGVVALHPGINPAGHALETQMLAELRGPFEIRSTGILPISPPTLAGADPMSGVAHDLILLEKPPELFHRMRSLALLKARYRRWRAEGWEPDVVMVYNLSPIYNQFLVWLRRQTKRPKLVLLLLDSPNLGVSLPQWKRFRRRFKPMYTPDSEMIGHFDACVGLSKATQKYFRPTTIPFLWMPGGCTPARAELAQTERDGARNGPLRLGYFGSLGEHAGVRLLAETLLATQLPLTLEICGYGRLNEAMAARAAADQRLKFHGLQTPSACLAFGRSCDVLVNPRPDSHGNENNFPSKVFDYALVGRAILSSNLSGVDEVLGPDGYYFDAHTFQSSLQQMLLSLSKTDRAELDRRGISIQQRVMTEFSWAKQGGRLALFLTQVCTGEFTEPGTL